MNAKARRTQAGSTHVSERIPERDVLDSDDGAPTVRTVARPGGSGAPPTEATLVDAVLAGVRLVTVPATEAQNGFGRLVDQAAAGEDIAITRHNVERVVLVSAARYRDLIAGEVLARERRDVRGSPTIPALDRLTAEFETMFARMQLPEVREATARALQATPEEMGQAAVAAARAAAQDASRPQPSREAEFSPG